MSQDLVFEELAARHRRELQKHCLRYVRSVHDSEDLVQETLLRAWRGRHTYQGRGSRRAWLYRIATNACHDALAYRRRHRHELRTLAAYAPATMLVDGREHLAVSGSEPGAELIADESAEQVVLVAVALPRRQGTALILRYLAGLTTGEAAALVVVSEAAVNSAAQRGRAALKERFPTGRIELSRFERSTRAQRALARRFTDAIENTEPTKLRRLARAHWRGGGPDGARDQG